MVNTFTDVQARRPLTILPDSRKESLERFLRDIPPAVKTRIREACIDMDTMLIAAVEEELPQVPVVVEHFHLIQDANRREIPKKIFLIGREKLSPSEKERLAKYGRFFPSLKEFHWMKEQLRRFYALKSKIKSR